MKKKYYIANTEKIPSSKNEEQEMYEKANVGENDVLVFAGIRFEECGFVKKREATEIEKMLIKQIEELIKTAE